MNIPAFIVDPVVVDELEPIARISGFSLIERKYFSCIKPKSSSKKVRKEVDRNYTELQSNCDTYGWRNYSWCSCKGKVIDVNNGLHGDGPFSPERAGTVPAGRLVAFVFQVNTLERSNEKACWSRWPCRLSWNK